MTLEKLMAGINKKHYAVLGRAGIDLFATPINVKSEHASQFNADLGGSSANICVGLCKLGAKSSLMTSLSDDAVGRFCKNKLKEYGVETDYIKTVGGEYRTSLALYESCIEDFQNVIYRNGAVDFQVEAADMDRIDFSSFGALITTGTVFAAEPSRSATFHAFDLAKKAGIPIIFDIDYRPYSWPSAEVASEILTRAGEASDMIVGNDEEFGFMAGDFNKGLEKAQVLAKNAQRVAIYKMGSQGAVSFVNGEEIKTSIYPVQAVKPNGAGDSFMAGLLASLGDGYGWKESILRGSACASIVVSKPGCAPSMPYKDELKEFLSTR